MGISKARDKHDREAFEVMNTYLQNAIKELTPLALMLGNAARSSPLSSDADRKMPWDIYVCVASRHETGHPSSTVLQLTRSLIPKEGSDLHAPLEGPGVPAALERIAATIRRQLMADGKMKPSDDQSIRIQTETKRIDLDDVL